MNISGLFIRRPVTTTLVMLGILIFGIMGYRSLPVSDLPTVQLLRLTPIYRVPVPRRWRPQSPRRWRKTFLR